MKFPGWLRLRPADCEGLGVSTRILGALYRVSVMTLDEALDGKLKSPGDHNRAKVTVTAITSESGECVSREVCAGILVCLL